MRKRELEMVMMMMMVNQPFLDRELISLNLNQLKHFREKIEILEGRLVSPGDDARQ